MSTGKCNLFLPQNARFYRHILQIIDKCKLQLPKFCFFLRKNRHFENFGYYAQMQRAFFYTTNFASDGFISKIEHRLRGCAVDFTKQKGEPDSSGPPIWWVLRCKNAVFEGKIPGGFSGCKSTLSTVDSSAFGRGFDGISGTI